MAGWTPDRHRVRSVLQRLASVAAALLLWAAVARFGPWPDYLLPGPVAVGTSLWEMALDGRLARGVAVSMWRLVRGYGLTLLIGVPLGVAMGRLRWVRNVMQPFVMGLQALPSICWLPLALLWFGLSDTAIIFVVVMGSLLGMSIAVEDGVRGVDPLLLKVSGTYGIRGARLQLGVLLPAALPSIVTGMKLAWSFAWRALLAGELLFVSGGLGELLTIGRELMEIPQVMAVMVCIVLIGLAVDFLIFQPLQLMVRRRWGIEAT